MASTDDIVELMENPDFKILVAQMIAAVAMAQDKGVSANVACDALQYVNALIYEANPEYGGPKGLRDAHKQIGADSKAMLCSIRDASMRRGQPVLFSMLERPTLN